MQPPKRSVLRFDAIGSRFWIEDLSGNSLPLAVQQQLVAYSNSFDDTYSRFKRGSLVVQLAKHGRLANPPSELLAMLEQCRQLYTVTAGAFNPTVGAALSRLGYGERYARDQLLQNPWEAIAWSQHEVNAPLGTVLDFGGLGKGWLIDNLAQILQQNGIPRFIVNGGGDLYVKNNKPVEFALEDPIVEGRVLQTVNIQQGALAGSSVIKRAWNNHGARKHHIINPITGDSSESGIIASYVLADTAVIADSLATVLIVNPKLNHSLKQQFNVRTLLITAPA